MTDRETLELAAKAIGMEYTEALHALNKQCVRSNLHPSWDPLANDGDALRLAVSLEIAVFPPKVPRQIGDLAIASTPDEYEGGWIQEFVCTDPGAATRRAIVRAAAEIGKSMLSDTPASPAASPD